MSRRSSGCWVISSETKRHRSGGMGGEGDLLRRIVPARCFTDSYQVSHMYVDLVRDVDMGMAIAVVDMTRSDMLPSHREPKIQDSYSQMHFPNWRARVCRRLRPEHGLDCHAGARRPSCHPTPPPRCVSPKDSDGGPVVIDAIEDRDCHTPGTDRGYSSPPSSLTRLVELSSGRISHTKTFASLSSASSTTSISTHSKLVAFRILSSTDN